MVVTSYESVSIKNSPKTCRFLPRLLERGKKSYSWTLGWSTRHFKNLLQYSGAAGRGECASALRTFPE